MHLTTRRCAGAPACARVRVRPYVRGYRGAKLGKHKLYTNFTASTLSGLAQQMLTPTETHAMQTVLIQSTQLTEVRAQF